MLAEACRLVTEWNDDEGIALLRKEMTAARTQSEAVHKTVWWEHVHFDALWPMTQLHGSVFGVVGMHATIEVAGRFQIFVAPGAILLNVPKDRFPASGGRPPTGALPVGSPTSRCPARTGAPTCISISRRPG